MKKIILIFIFLFSCSNSNINNSMVDDIDFDKEISFEEFNNKIIHYSKNSGYPDINN